MPIHMGDFPAIKISAGKSDGILYPLVNIQKAMENHHDVVGQSTISTGPFSSSQTVSLPGRVSNFQTHPL